MQTSLDFTPEEWAGLVDFIKTENSSETQKVVDVDLTSLTTYRNYKEPGAPSVYYVVAVTWELIENGGRWGGWVTVSYETASFLEVKLGKVARDGYSGHIEPVRQKQLYGACVSALVGDDDSDTPIEHLHRRVFDLVGPLTYAEIKLVDETISSIR